MENIKKTEEKEGTTFYPSHLFKEMVVMMFVFVLVSFILALVFPVKLGDPADPTDSSFVPKPEWYFLAIFQLLKYFPGVFEAIAAVGVPVGSIILLMLLPLIDKNPERRPRKRPIAMALMVIILAVTAILTLLGAVT
ncbi:MAG: hypothetical protein HY957_09300 [Nitrospirae bacterium]|nr:hypothetical protein [Nitrospirota bacterium]